MLEEPVEGLLESVWPGEAGSSKAGPSIDPVLLIGANFFEGPSGTKALPTNHTPIPHPHNTSFYLILVFRSRHRFDSVPEESCVASSGLNFSMLPFMFHHF